MRVVSIDRTHTEKNRGCTKSVFYMGGFQETYNTRRGFHQSFGRQRIDKGGARALDPLARASV